MSLGPSAEDYIVALRDRFDGIRVELQKEFAEIQAQATKAGTFRSGRTAIRFAEVGREAFRKTAAMVFGEEKRAELLDGMLDDLEPVTEEQLSNFRIEIAQLVQEYAARSAGNSASAMDAVLKTIPLQQDQQRFLRLHRVEMFTPAAPSPLLPSVTNNNLSIGNAIGSAVQQGATGATVNVTNQVDFRAITEAVEVLERAMDDVSGDAQPVIDLRSDVVGLKSQLKKSHPATEVLKEIGVSIRNIVEGAAGGTIGSALTPAIIGAASSLAAVLGA